MPTSNIPQATVWAQNAEMNLGYDFRAPSGQLCRLRKADLQQLVFDGVIDDVDAVTRVVNADIMKKKPGAKRKSQDQQFREGLEFIASDTGRTAIDLMDVILPHVIVAPVVHRNPKDGEERESGKIYVSDIDISDRAAIFAEAMKSVEAAATFRD